MSAGTGTAVDVRAAGGIVWRAGEAGVCEVLVVHRPKYRDWSFPKGKQEPGETDEETALREVEEETGLVCHLGPELPGTAYVDRKGRTKEVRYWVMTVSTGEFAPSDEVDEVRWLSVPLARDQLTYDRDRTVLDAFAE
ncbi:MAG: NUDIX hydrolase [Acidimicrobiia bacterium]|nr:NUDIX hydrolase [Acidimicrobiia bacterium]